MKIPKKLQCTTIEDALATAAGIIDAIPFWHADLIAAAIAMRKKNASTTCHQRFNTGRPPPPFYLGLPF